MRRLIVLTIVWVPLMMAAQLQAVSAPVMVPVHGMVSSSPTVVLAP